MLYPFLKLREENCEESRHLCHSYLDFTKGKQEVFLPVSPLKQCFSKQNAEKHLFLKGVIHTHSFLFKVELFSRWFGCMGGNAAGATGTGMLPLDDANHKPMPRIIPPCPITSH